MLSGLAESDRVGVVDDKIAQWLTEDRYLSQIAHYFRFAATLNATTLQKVIQAGIRLKNDDVVAPVVFRRYKDGTPALIDEVILPGIAYFTERQDARWINLAWFIKKDNSCSAWVVIFGVELCNDPGRRGDYADLAAVRAGASVAMVHRNIGDGRKR